MNTVPALDDADDRRAIRDALDDTLVVEAAAGTGKTTELVNRIVAILATGRASVQQIVAVTFTEKAAGELKLRLREALERARGSEPGPHAPESGVRRSSRSARLEEALAHLEEAHVSTIHGFCADLLRERPVEGGVDPRFEVMLEPDARRLHRRAFDAWLQERLENPPEGVRRSLRRRADGDDGGPRARLRNAAWTLASWRDFPVAWRRDAFDRDAALAAVVETLHSFADFSALPAPNADTFFHDTRAARDLSDRIRQMVTAATADPDGLESAVVELSRDTTFTRPRKGYGAKYGAQASRAAVQELHAALVAALGRFRQAADADLAARLQHELAGANDKYEELKHRAGRLDFVDLLLRARDLVRDNDEVRASFQQRFARIFVDEFQDTDPLQAELLVLLASGDPAVRDWRRVRPLAGKLFVVGDPKQSIYRFRRADVGIYQEVKDQLLAHGARVVTLRTSFRSLPAIQHAVNAAFEPQMQGDRTTLQADYVRLMPYRAASTSQPSVVVLPVPCPYGARRISAQAIDKSLPDAICAFVEWLVNESGWQVAEREEGWRERRTRARERADGEEALVSVSPRHVCVLFRRFETYGSDVTRPYIEGLQARGIPHLLVGGRSFHARAEVEAMRAALTAIEWPDSALDVFATVHGPLFAVTDEALLEYRHTFGRLHPFRLPTGPVPDRLTPIVDALCVLRDLHKQRNHVPVTETIERLLAATRAHAGIVLRRSGEQALANVLQLAELARSYELSAWASSFRGFIDQLEEEAESGESPEAPILEEGAEGVRVMTVHRAKGLEFPVVILADMTASLARGKASRYIDSGRGLCAVRIAGWSPAELLEHEQEEVARDRAEAIRVAYVAATRARDLLVIPAVGDKPYDDKWLSPLNAAIYPALDARRTAQPAPTCPRFGKDSVAERPDGDPATSETVCPGLHRFAHPGAVNARSRTPDAGLRTPDSAGPETPDAGRWTPDSVLRTSNSGEYSVVWWDPRVLALGAPSSDGIRAEDLIGKDAEAGVVDADTRDYERWKAAREETIARASIPTVVVRSATAHAAASAVSGEEAVEVIHAAGGRQDEPSADATAAAGPRLGTLVHALLASVPLDARTTDVDRAIALQGRIFGATDEECASARSLVAAALRHTLIRRAHAADRAGRCRRETPVTLIDGAGALIEGVVDLAFEEDEGWTVVDFKTARDLEHGVATYRRQVALYAQAIAAATGRPARGVLFYL